MLRNIYGGYISKMNILVIGGGGREHAIVWKLSQSAKAEKIYCAPGNGGISGIAECLDIQASDIEMIISNAKALKADLVVIGPDEPLALGLADACESEGIRVFGPRRAESRLEWSKSYAKSLMLKHGIPTANCSICDNAKDALAALANFSAPYVIKTDGLALGKGVIITEDRAEAEAAIRAIMLDRIFGDSGSRVLLEECLTGPEMTVLALTDGKTIKPMICSQDHKRAFDGDLGPNTGGMGAFAPSPIYTEAVEKDCWNNIFMPTLEMMKKESIRYHGLLYFGLMLTNSGVKVIEYNARFGDPETQVILPLMKNDLIDVFDAVIDERLDNIELEWEAGCSACVIAASGGYPGKYATGYEIDIAPLEDVSLFHAGTRKEKSKFVTSGGRVLGVTAVAGTLGGAIEKAYSGIRQVSFKDMHYRRDIGRAWYVNDK